MILLRIEKIVPKNHKSCELEANNQILVVHAGIPGPRPRVWLPGQTHDPEETAEGLFFLIGFRV